jgi:hypothetical protein
MTCKARPISLEIPRIRSRPDCCNAAIFWELRFLLRFASILRPVRIRRGRAFFLLYSVKAQRWNYLRFSLPFGA